MARVTPWWRSPATPTLPPGCRRPRPALASTSPRRPALPTGCRIWSASMRWSIRRRAAGQPARLATGVHAEGAAALFAACEQAGVRRMVQISAIGVDRGAATAFARTKLAGDEALMARNLDWAILRPSVVVGRQAYAGSALFRGLAALPILPRLADAGLLQIVQLDDLVRTVLFLLRPGAPSRLVLEVVGPERLSLEAVLGAYRRWLGLREARFVTLPSWLAHVAFRVGDLIGLLGWRPPPRSTRARTIADRRIPHLGRASRGSASRPRRRAGGGARLGAGAMVCATLLRQAADVGGAGALLGRDRPGGAGPWLGRRRGPRPGRRLPGCGPTGCRTAMPTPMAMSAIAPAAASGAAARKAGVLDEAQRRPPSQGPAPPGPSRPSRAPAPPTSAA